MLQVACYMVLRQIMFPLSGYWTKPFLHANVKSNTITKFFLLFFVAVYKAPQKSPKRNVCPYCCTFLRYVLCNYLDGLKKERKNNCEMHCATADDFMLTPVTGFHPQVKCL